MFHWDVYLGQHLPETQGADNSQSGGLVSRMRESSLVVDSCGPGSDTLADAQTHQTRPEVDWVLPQDRRHGATMEISEALNDHTSPGKFINKVDY